MGLSIEQKYNICLMAERHPRWKQLELARWAYEVYQLPKCPSQGTISRLLAKKSVFMNTKEHEKSANRLRKPNNFLVRRILQEWASQSIWNGIPVTPPILQDTAQSIWHRIPPEMREGNGSFSYKWITHLLAKMDIAMDQELPKPPKVWTFEERADLKVYLSQLPPKDLFTLDETFLAYNLPLCFEQYETSGIQKRMEVITVMLCANMDGTEKLDPVVVGRYQNYLSFRTYFPDEHSGNVGSHENRRYNNYGQYFNNGVDNQSSNLNDHSSQADLQLGAQLAQKFGLTYCSNRKSWLTSNLFHDWLSSWDKRLVVNNRKIWIILDDSCSHRIINLRLKNIQLIYTSATSRFLPFNWGVFDEFKAGYRVQQYGALIDLQDTLAKQSGGVKRILPYSQTVLTMSNAFKFIKLAWDAIPSNTIKLNWKSSGILPPELIRVDESLGITFKRNEALESKLDMLCKRYYCKKKWDYEMLLDLNIENKNTNFLSSAEIIESAIVDQWEPDEYCSDSTDESLIDGVSGNQTDALPANSESFNIAPFNNEDSSTSNSTNLVTQQPLHDQLNYPHAAHLQSGHENIMISGRQSTVSALIDRSEDQFVNTMQQDMITDQIFSDMFDIQGPSTTAHEQASTMGGTTQSPSHIHQASHPPSRAEQQTPAYSELPPVPTNNTASQQEDIELTLDQSPLLSSEDLDATDLGNYMAHISSNSQNPLSNERLVMLATLQTNIDIARSMENILKHAEIREVGLSESALKEMKASYCSCIKKINKARQFLNVTELRKRRSSLEKHLLGGTGNKQMENGSRSSPPNRLPVDRNVFFDTFAETTGDLTSAINRSTSS